MVQVSSIEIETKRTRVQNKTPASVDQVLSQIGSDSRLQAYTSPDIIQMLMLLVYQR